MNYVKRILWLLLIVIIASTILPICHANADELKQESWEGIMEVEEKNDENAMMRLNRNEFDIASFLSLFSIGFLKFVDDKLKIKFKEKYKKYKFFLLTVTVLFALIEISILICYLFSIGSVKFGNIKNLLLGFIPLLFCILTMLTEKNILNPIVLTQKELEKRINEFTACGMAPLCMIVGDMDFFGKVYDNNENQKRRRYDDITLNSQINAIVDNNIDTINIVCKKPTTCEAKRRVGYLLEEFEGRFHIRFFEEEKYPIPKMRGRIMFKQNEQVVVITKKIRKPKEYEYSEYVESSLPGGLFLDLWKTVWGCSEENKDVMNDCRDAYATFIGREREKSNG